MIKRITNIRVTTSCTGTIAAPEMPDHLISAMLEVARYERDLELETLCLCALASATGLESCRAALTRRYATMRRCDRHRDEPGLYAETHPCVLPAVHSVTIDHMDSTGRMWPELTPL